MGIARGPNLIKDNLVFGYDNGHGVSDAATPTRFYKGKPAINMLTSGDNFANWNKTFNSAPHVTITSDVAPGPFNGTLADKMSIPTGGTYPRIYQNYTPASTATHTFSVWLKAETPGQSVFVGAFRNSPWALPSSTSFTITSEWVNYSLPINPQDTTSMQIYIGSHDSHKGKEFLIYGAQLEVGTVKSLFVNGERSGTSTLIDVKKTSSILIQDASFDSTGMFFDGSNDYIRVPSTAYSFSSGATVEQVIKFTTINRQQGFFSLGNGTGIYINFWMSTNNLMRWEVIGDVTTTYSTITATTAVTAGKHYHFVGVFDGATTTIYVNGVAETTQSMTNQPIAVTSQMEIGRYNTSYPSASRIPVTRFYNQPLTAAQVKSNYNTYKNRFNI